MRPPESNNSSKLFNFTSGNVTGSECYDELLSLRAFGPRLGHDVLVENLNGALEAGELGHRVRDLTAPQRPDRLVEDSDTLLGPDLKIKVEADVRPNGLSQSEPE